MDLSCFRCQPLSYYSLFVIYQPLSFDFGCQPLLCTCVLCTVYSCTVLCTGVLYILGLSCLAVNLSFMILVVKLYYVLVYCVLVYCAIIGVLIMLGLSSLAVTCQPWSINWCTVHAGSIILHACVMSVPVQPLFSKSIKKMNFKSDTGQGQKL